MRTTIELPDSLLREAKAVANERGLTLKKLFEDALTAALRQESKPFSRMERPPVRLGETGPVSAYDNAKLALILENEELLKSR